jgi:hypothetical protein
VVAQAFAVDFLYSMQKLGKSVQAWALRNELLHRFACFLDFHELSLWHDPLGVLRQGAEGARL